MKAENTKMTDAKVEQQVTQYELQVLDRMKQMREGGRRHKEIYMYMYD